MGRRIVSDTNKKKETQINQSTENQKERALRNSDDVVLARAIRDLLKRDETKDGYVN